MRKAWLLGALAVVVLWLLPAAPAQACEKCAYILFNGWRCTTQASGTDDCQTRANGAGCDDVGAVCPAGSGPGPGGPENNGLISPAGSPMRLAGFDSSDQQLVAAPELLVQTCQYTIE